MYNFNISSANHTDYDDLVTKTLKLSRQIDTWRKSSSPFQVPVADSTTCASTSGSLGAEKYEVLLSIHYYRTVLLVNGPLLMGTLESVARCDGLVPDISQDVATSLLKRDFVATKELSKILSCIVQGDPAFFRRNASWWICNYGGEFMVQVYQRKANCQSFDSMPSSPGFLDILSRQFL